MAFDSILSLHFFALRISQMSKALIVYFVSHGMTRKVCVLSTWTVAKNWMPHSNHVGRNTRVQFKFTTIQSLHPFSRIVHSHRRLFVLCVCVCSGQYCVALESRTFRWRHRLHHTVQNIYFVVFLNFNFHVAEKRLFPQSFRWHRLAKVLECIYLYFIGQNSHRNAKK